MATLLKSGGLFLHVPKTGGNWVGDVLEAHDLVFTHLGGKHAGLPQLAPLLRLLETPRRYDRPTRPLFTFCFVRHPLRWYESWYRMNVARGWPQWAADDDAWNPSVTLNGLGAPTFNGFIRNVLEQQPGFVTRLYDSYTRDAHFVGRQERMTADLAAVLDLLNVTIPRGTIASHQPVNVSARVGVGVDLDPGIRQALEDAEHAAYERYGYSEAGSTDSDLRGLFTACDRATPLIGPFRHDSGCAWQAEVAALSRFADGESTPCRSLLSLLEDGRPLPIAHALHADIRSTGRGRFSHWGDSLLFAASDNSDPNRNGRRYAIAWAAPGPPGVTHLLAQPATSSPGALV